MHIQHVVKHTTHSELKAHKSNTLFALTNVHSENCHLQNFETSR